VKYNKKLFYLFIYLFIPFFSLNAPTGQTAGPIFTHDGSFDAELPKDVPFGGLDDIGPHLGGQAPKHPKYGSE